MAKYSPYKMKGHTLPGIQQKKSPAKDYGHEPEKPEGHTHSKEDPSAMTGVIGGENEDKVINESGNWVKRSSRKDLLEKEDNKKSPGKWAQFIPLAISAVSAMSKKKKEE